MSNSRLPAPRGKLPEIPSTSGPKHEFVLPPNRAGQAPKLRPGRRPAVPTPVRPITPAAPPLTAPAPLPQVLYWNPAPVMETQAQTPAPQGAAVLGPRLLPSLAPPVIVAAPAAPVPQSTLKNRRRRAQEEATGVLKRKYVRQATLNKCASCGNPKTKEFGHSRFRSATFCPSSSTLCLEEWLAQQRQNQTPPT